MACLLVVDDDPLNLELIKADPRFAAVLVVMQTAASDPTEVAEGLVAGAWYYLEFDPERAFHSHGRGIAMSRQISFASLEYQGCGNE